MDQMIEMKYTRTEAALPRALIRLRKTDLPKFDKRFAG